MRKNIKVTDSQMEMVNKVLANTLVMNPDKTPPTTSTIINVAITLGLKHLIDNME